MSSAESPGSSLPGALCSAGPGSDRHLGTDLHHAPGGDLEIVGGIVGAARQRDEQAVLPAWHARLRGRLERAPRQEERGRHDVELRDVLAGNGEWLWAVWRCHE